MTITTTCQPMTGGVNAITGAGADTLFVFGGTWATGDNYSVILTDNVTGVQTLVGAGPVTGTQPIFCYTFSQKEYVLADASTYFSSVGDSTVFDSLTASGNGNVLMSNFCGTPESLISICVYQGKLSFFSRYTTNIWQVSADPTAWQLLQTLNNIGTFASLSVAPLGDLDVLFLSDSGIRSLRVRDSSDNAFVADLGAPIDIPVQANLASGSVQSNAAACGGVEPTGGRYWCFINNTIYVLSYYPTSKIVGWSTYLPTYKTTLVNTNGYTTYPVGKQITFTVVAGVVYHWTPGIHEVSMTCGSFTSTVECLFTAGATTVTVTGTASGATITGVLTTQTPFTPQKFVVFNGLVYTRDATTIYVYGGTNGNTYDDCLATLTVPFYDAKRPGTKKQARGIDADIQGTWSLYASPNWIDGTYTLVQANATKSTFDQGWLPYEDFGTHFSLQATSYASTYAAVSAFLLHYELCEQPAE